MMQESSVYLGLINPKSPENVGMVMRAAGCYEADKIFYTGERYNRARQFYTDTKNAHTKIPFEWTHNLLLHAPAKTEIVVVELIEGATPLMDFNHPQHAYYIFGPEDGSVNQEVVDQSNHVIYIPTIGCMNLAATVNVVLYDRLAKSSRSVVQERPISVHRDSNSRARINPVIYQK